MRHRPTIPSTVSSVAFAIFAAAALVSPAHAQETRLLDAPFLDTLRAEVRTNHPSVAAAQARVLAADAGVRGVRL
jgi:outer membrane protein TolC